MADNSIRYTKTTTGDLILINGVITWFIRYEPMLYWQDRHMLYRSNDGGRGWTLIPSNDSDKVSTWGHKSLMAAQTWAIIHTNDCKGCK